MLSNLAGFQMPFVSSRPLIFSVNCCPPLPIKKGL